MAPPNKLPLHILWIAFFIPGLLCLLGALKALIEHNKEKMEERLDEALSFLVFALIFSMLAFLF
jgi:crotonobetainyl-CoA:carnitine CoA-transferase CaiB-like acyl-CoA transferase